MSVFEAGMEGMVDMYIYETTTLLEQLDQILMQTEEEKQFSSENINEIFRAMHTIKGSSSMMGLKNMSILAHSIEDMFYIIREEEPKIGSMNSLYEIVFAASDLMKAEVDIVQNDDYSPTDFTKNISDIEKFVVCLKGKCEENPSEAVTEEKENITVNPNEGMTTIRVIFEDDCEMENLRALLLINKIKDECKKLEYEPSDIEKNSDTAKIIVEKGFIIRFIPVDSDKVIFNEIEEALNVKSYEVIYGEKTKSYQNKSENPVEIDDKKDQPKATADVKLENKSAKKEIAEINNAIANNENVAVHKNKGKQSLISVNLNKLDQLLDMVGEIVIAEAMVISNPDIKDLKIDNFQKAARQLRKLTGELQDIVMSIRMVPLSGVFNKMTRIVRDMKVELNKDVNLVFKGEDTEVDKGVIDMLNDPLMHMVRNSMDHGIEEIQEERINNGKPAQGTITLSAYNSSGEVIIVVSDDGRGINTKKVLSKAEKNGLLKKDKSEYTEKEIFNMVMLPGFSTSESVTEFSGRGVGMDVVRQNIEKIGGTVSVDSKLGMGTNFIIKIPLSLAIIDGIEISVGSSIFTIPVSSIKEFIKIKENQIFEDSEGKQMVVIRNKCYPLIKLCEIYGIKPLYENVQDGVIVLVEEEGKCGCILVDKLIGEQQVVVKPFSPMLNKYDIKEKGMAGCTILGDGSITIILDIAGLIKE